MAQDGIRTQTTAELLHRHPTPSRVAQPAAISNASPAGAPAALSDASITDRGAALATFRSLSAIDVQGAVGSGEPSALTSQRAEPALPATRPAGPRPDAPAPARIEPGRAPVPVEPHELAVQVERNKALELRAGRMEREVQLLRSELSRLQSAKRAAELQLIEAKRLVTELGRPAVRDTLSYELGSALFDATRSVRGYLSLPKRLYGLYRRSRTMRAQKASKREKMPASLGRAAEAAHIVNTALEAVRSSGVDAAVAWSRKQELRPAILANVLIEIAKFVRHDDPAAAARIGREAIETHASESRVKWLAFAMAEDGNIVEAADLIDCAISAGAMFNATEAKKADNVRALRRLLTNPPVIPPPGQQRPTGGERHYRVAHIGRESLPFHATTAAWRLHERARLTAMAGWEVAAVTPPGYPLRRRSRHPLLKRDLPLMLGGLRYLRLEPTESAEEIADLYIAEAAEQIGTALYRAGASIVHADGFGALGIASAIAARTLGLPFVCDISELWSPHDSFSPGIERTAGFKLTLELPILAASAADLCLVRNELLAQILVASGVPTDRMAVLPEAFPDAPASPVERDGVLAHELALGDGPVIGFVGDLVEHNAVTLLADLLAALRETYPTLKLLAVGQGRGAQQLRTRLGELQLSSAAIVLDRFDATELPRYLSLLDVAVILRPYDMTTALAAPYDLARAMAYGVPVVVARTADALKTALEDEDALMFDPSDVSELVHKTGTLLADGARRRMLAARAQSNYRRHAGPEIVARRLAELYEGLAMADAARALAIPPR